MDRFESHAASRDLCLIVQDGPAPGPKDEHRVETIWQEELRKRQGRLHDGTILEYVAFEGDRLVGRFVSYKDYIVSRREPNAVGRAIVPLAVSGITWFGGCAGWGRRAEHVTSYPCCLELFPSGSIEPAFLGA